jgi:hypothetical protein
MSRPKKPAPPWPTANELEQLRSRLQTLVSTGEANRVDGELEQLLRSLGLDPASPTAWRDGFLLLACLHYDVGKPRRTNKNAKNLSTDDNVVLCREMIQLMGRGLTEPQAIKELAGDRRKEHLFKFKPLSSTKQREQTLQKRLDKIKEASRGDTWLRDVIGKPPESIVEDALLNLVLCEAMKAIEKRNGKLDRS